MPNPPAGAPGDTQPGFTGAQAGPSATPPAAVHHAGLVVRDASGDLRYASVSFREPEISGIELLRRSGLPVLTAGFGGLGEAVCDIGGTGCDLAECRRRLCQGPRPDDPFWQAFQQTAPGVWQPFPLGASSIRVRDGDIVGWSWTGTEPGLPRLTLAEIAARAAAAPPTAAAPSPPDRPRLAGGILALLALGVAGPLLARDGRRRTRRRPLDPRAWLLWYLAASLPVLVGRNPFPLLAALIVALSVRAVWGGGREREAAGWRGVVRLACGFAVVAVAFNLLTVHAGDRVLLTLPARWPIIGGDLTLNALVYGILSGLALVTLVLLGTLLATVLDWAALLRLLPDRLATLAVAGAVAWALVPTTLAAFTEIREAQLARGHRLRGPRGVLPLLMPLLAGSLERALTMAAALETRGFGAIAAVAPPPAAWRQGLLALGLVGLVTGAYLLAAGELPAGVAVVAASGGALWLGWRRLPGATMARTRYRDPIWAKPEWLVAGAAAIALLVELTALAVVPSAFLYSPYPVLAAPAAEPALLVAMGLLLAPAVATP